MGRRKISRILAVAVCAVMIFAASGSVTAAGSNSGAVNSTLSKDVKIINGKVYVPADDTPKVISRLSSSVVGIMGKLKQSSKNYNSYSDNLIFGSGVIYKSNGYIVTNAHVVADMESIVVVLSNGKAYNARLKAIDELSDLALIKIDKGMLTPAELGDMSGVEVGMPVIAIGTPLSFSLRNSASKGIISGINRSTDGEYRFIQSDAAINGGNSGGPLVDMQGRVIGINTVKYIGYGVEGLSFSIPIDTVKYVLGHFEKYGKVRRPYLGAVFMEGVAARYGLPSNEGVVISKVEKDSPAEKAGLQIDDVIKSVNGVNITTRIDYNEEVKKYLPGDSTIIVIEREKKENKVKVVFNEYK